MNSNFNKGGSALLPLAPLEIITGPVTLDVIQQGATTMHRIIQKQ